METAETTAERERERRGRGVYVEGERGIQGLY